MKKTQNNKPESLMLIEDDNIRLNDALYEKQARQTTRFLLGQWVICEMEIKQVIEINRKSQKITGVRDAQTSCYCRKGYKVFALSNSNLCWSSAIQKLYDKATKVIVEKHLSNIFIPLYDYFVNQHNRCLSYKSEEKRLEVYEETNERIEKAMTASASYIQKNLFK